MTRLDERMIASLAFFFYLNTVHINRYLLFDNQSLFTQTVSRDRSDASTAIPICWELRVHAISFSILHLTF
jgi:hypothetical protein